MQRTCDICQPSSRNYVVFLKNRMLSEKLSTYFASQADWEPVGKDQYLLKEKSFYDLMDYAEAHLSGEDVLASNAPSTVSQIHVSEMKPLLSFKSERETGWVDEMIQKKKIGHLLPTDC